MRDSFGREITYARISVTDLCNLRCRYCMPDGVEKKPHCEILTIEQLVEISDTLARLGVYKQRVTGGEPLVRRGVMSLISHMGKNPDIQSVAITTNGQLLEECAVDLFRAGVRRLNISLDTLDENKYELLTSGGSVKKTLRGIEAAHRAGFTDIKLNAVLLRGINDAELCDIARFGKSENLTVRFIELMPFSSQEKYAKEYFIGTNEIVKMYDLRNVDVISTWDKAVRYAFSDGTEAAFISPLTHKFCAYCNRIRITADGKLLNCLHESQEYNLMPYLGGRGLEKFIEGVVLKKPREHNLQEGVLQTRIMENIGG